MRVSFLVQLTILLIFGTNPVQKMILSHWWGYVPYSEPFIVNGSCNKLIGQVYSYS